MAPAQVDRGQGPAARAACTRAGARAAAPRPRAGDGARRRAAPARRRPRGDRRRGRRPRRRRPHGAGVAGRQRAGWPTSSARRASCCDAGEPMVWDTLTRKFEGAADPHRARDHARPPHRGGAEARHRPQHHHAQDPGARPRRQVSRGGSPSIASDRCDESWRPLRRGRHLDERPRRDAQRWREDRPSGGAGRALDSPARRSMSLRICFMRRRRGMLARGACRAAGADQAETRRDVPLPGQRLQQHALSAARGREAALQEGRERGGHGDPVEPRSPPRRLAVGRAAPRGRCRRLGADRCAGRFGRPAHVARATRAALSRGG